MGSSNISVNSVTIYYEHHGQPQDSGCPVLVMVHGYLSSTFSFRKLIPLLKDQYIIYALDLPGFGQSEKSLNFVYSMDNYGSIVLGFLKRMALEQVILVGHSMGGQICLQAVKQAPDMIKKLVLFNASGYLGPARKLLVYASYIPFFSFGLRKYFERMDPLKTIHDVVYDHDSVDDNMVEGYIRPIKDPSFFKSLLRLVRHREGDLLTNDLKLIRHPILIIWGREDRIVPLSIGRRLVNDLPNATLKIYDKTGHLVPEERAYEVAEDIYSFLNNPLVKVIAKSE